MAKTPTPLAPWLKVDPALVFDPSEYPGCRKRVKPIQAGVGHWTGGPDFSAAQVVHILRTRKDPDTGKPEPLSVCFCIDPQGDAWQFTDPSKVVTYHAGKVNDEAFGVEISSPGFPPVRKVARALVEHEVHGRLVKQVAFTPKQLETYVKLCDLMAAEFGIPKVVPGLKGELFSGVMSRAQAEAWRGFGEHLHFSTKKSDGGTQLSRALMEAGYALGTF